MTSFFPSAATIRRRRLVKLFLVVAAVVVAANVTARYTIIQPRLVPHWLLLLHGFADLAVLGACVTGVVYLAQTRERG